MPQLDLEAIAEAIESIRRDTTDTAPVDEPAVAFALEDLTLGQVAPLEATDGHYLMQLRVALIASSDRPIADLESTLAEITCAPWSLQNSPPIRASVQLRRVALAPVPQPTTENDETADTGEQASGLTRVVGALRTIIEFKPHFIIVLAPEGILPISDDLTATRLAGITRQLQPLFGSAGAGPHAMVLVCPPVLDREFFETYRSLCVARATLPIALLLRPEQCDQIARYVRFESRHYVRHLTRVHGQPAEDLADGSLLAGLELDL